MKLNEWNFCAEFDSNGIHERVFSKTYKCLYRLCVCASIRQGERSGKRWIQADGQTCRDGPKGRF